MAGAGGRHSVRALVTLNATSFGSGHYFCAVESSQKPKLRFLHTADAMNAAKLEGLRRLPSDAIASSLQPAQSGSLKVRPDGTVLDGHHRLAVLLERGENVDQLPREIMEQDNYES